MASALSSAWRYLAIDSIEMHKTPADDYSLKMVIALYQHRLRRAIGWLRADVGAEIVAGGA